MRQCPTCQQRFDDAIAFCTRDGTLLRQEDAAAPADASQLPIGAVVGNYRILELIASGGMGHVLLAEHTQLGKRMALKLLKPELTANPSMVHRFFREARAATLVGHENVIEIFDFVEEGDRKYFVMELLRGEPLSKVMIREKVLPLARTLHIMTQVADALAAVHAAGIIHRDLKPDNIFLTERAKQRDFVKLYDFGVAKLLTLDDTSQPTQQGMLLGTPAYMSPEQLLGHPIDGRVDIYALGVILFIMLTGRRPYKGKTLPELMLKVCHEAVPAPSSLPNLPHSIPASLESLVLRCLAKKPEDRPQTMAELRDALQAIAARSDSSTLVLDAPFDPAAIAKIEALSSHTRRA